MTRAKPPAGGPPTSPRQTGPGARPAAALAVAGAVLALTPAAASAKAGPGAHELQARVQAVRAALEGLAPPGAAEDALPSAAGDTWHLAQAASWTNWPKWSKWSNWGNK